MGKFRFASFYSNAFSDSIGNPLSKKTCTAGHLEGENQPILRGPKIAQCLLTTYKSRPWDDSLQGNRQLRGIFDVFFVSRTTGVFARRSWVSQHVMLQDGHPLFCYYNKWPKINGVTVVYNPSQKGALYITPLKELFFLGPTLYLHGVMVPGPNLPLGALFLAWPGSQRAKVRSS